VLRTGGPPAPLGLGALRTRKGRVGWRRGGEKEEEEEGWWEEEVVEEEEEEGRREEAERPCFGWLVDEGGVCG